MNPPTHPSSSASGGTRRISWSVLRQTCLGLATLGVVLGLFYGVENWRGWRAWSAERAAVAQNHTPLEWTEVVPPPVPDEQNLANTQPFLRLFDWQHDANGHWNNTNYAVGQAWCDLTSINGRSSLPGVGVWARVGTEGTNGTVDLAEWQKFFRAPAQWTKKHVVEARQRRGLPVPEGLPTKAKALPTNAPPAYPLPLLPGRPAEDVLLALKVFETELATVAEGTRRPHARFPIRYEDGPSALMPHLASVKRLVSVFTLRAVARLEEGQTEGALDDLRVALVLAETGKEEPLLLSQMVRYTSLQLALQTVWEGVVRHRWSGSQLETIQGWLAAIDVQPGMQRALAAERMMVNGILRTILASSQGRREMAGMFDSLSILSGPGGGGETTEFASTYLFWAPRGWLYENAAEISRALRTLETAAPSDLPRLAPHWPPPPPSTSVRYLFYRAYLRPDSDGALVRSALKAYRAQAQVRLALTACALERHRLTENHYPDRLESLVPRWIQSLPVDPMDGKPLRYARDGEERFRLWSVADNLEDDGGPTAKGGKDPTALGSLDWVWAWPSR